MKENLEQLKIRVYDLIMERERVLKESDDSVIRINNEIMDTQQEINQLLNVEDGYISEEGKF